MSIECSRCGEPLKPEMEKCPKCGSRDRRITIKETLRLLKEEISLKDLTPGTINAYTTASETLSDYQSCYQKLSQLFEIAKLRGTLDPAHATEIQQVLDKWYGYSEDWAKRIKKSVAEDDSENLYNVNLEMGKTLLPLVKEIHTEIVGRAPAHPKILFLTANPKSPVKLRLDDEVRDIEHKIMLAQKKDQLILVNRGAVRVNDLQLYLNQEKPIIVHFSGHGTDEGEIILEDEMKNAKIVPPVALAMMFKVLKDNIRCVVLNACFSSEQAHAIAEHIDCVIGMSSSISDEAARKFSSAFYLAIASERSIENAFDQGITELMLEDIPEEHIPKLMVRNNVDPSKIFVVQPRRSYKKPTTDRLSKEEAETIALAEIKRKEKGVSDIEVTSLEREKGGWVVKGEYSAKIGKELDWAFNFIIRIDKDGEIVAYNFNA
jgi:hypothetical protein